MSPKIISDDVHGTAVESFWAGTSFLLASAGFQLVFASFSHIFGRKPILVSALTIFTTGSVIAGIASTFTAIIVGRSLQGIGGGGVIVLTQIIITDMVPLRTRGKWFGFISGT